MVRTFPFFGRLKASPERVSISAFYDHPLFTTQAGAFAVICEFLEYCSGAVVLATSREALHVRGEHEYLLQPLDIQSAAGLFVERGCVLQPHLQPDRNDRGLSLSDPLRGAVFLSFARILHDGVLE
jgi:hypothetical protein